MITGYTFRDESVCFLTIFVITHGVFVSSLEITFLVIYG
jgi:hypothetical protein